MPVDYDAFSPLPLPANIPINRLVNTKTGRPSSSGLGRRPFTAETGVRFPLGVPFFLRGFAHSVLQAYSIILRPRRAGMQFRSSVDVTPEFSCRSLSKQRNCCTFPYSKKLYFRCSPIVFGRQITALRSPFASGSGASPPLEQRRTDRDLPLVKAMPYIASA